MTSGLPSEPIGRDALAGAYFVGFDMRQPGGTLRTIAAGSAGSSLRRSALPRTADASAAR